MQITRIECRLGATINAGDFQSVKSEVMAQADIERNEDPVSAYQELAEFVRASLVTGAQSAQPDAVRKMLTADARLSEAAQGNKKAATTKKAAPSKVEAPKLADTTGMDVGGLDKEPQADAPAAPAEDDLSGLLDDAAPAEAVTQDQVKGALVKLNKKGGKTAVLEVLKTFGASSLSQLPETKYGEAFQLAEKKAASIADA